MAVYALYVYIVKAVLYTLQGLSESHIMIERLSIPIISTGVLVTANTLVEILRMKCQI